MGDCRSKEEVPVVRPVKCIKPVIRVGALGVAVLPENLLPADAPIRPAATPLKLLPSATVQDKSPLSRVKET